MPLADHRIFTLNGYAGKHLKPYRDFVDHSYISLSRGYFFHTIGKAANSSVKAIFYHLELTSIHWKLPSVHDRVSSPLLSPFQLDPDSLQRVFSDPNFIRFVFVRNPYSRLLSCYLDRIHDKKSRPYRSLCSFYGKPFGYSFEFEEFIELICEQNDYQQNNHWRLMHADSMSEFIDYTFIGRQETFEADMRKLLGILGEDPSRFNMIDRSNSPQALNSDNRLAQFWRRRSIALVQARYAKDFEYFGYDSEQI